MIEQLKKWGIVAGSLMAIFSFIGYVSIRQPFALAEDYEDLKAIVITNTETSEDIKTEMVISRLERKVDRLDGKINLTDFEQDELEEINKKIAKLEEKLDD